MTTPLSQFANARMLFTAPGQRGDASTGYKVGPGSQYVIEAFLKQGSAVEKAKVKEVIDLSIGQDWYAGYIIGYCELPEGENWLTIDPRQEESYNATGLRPPGLRFDSKVSLSLPPRKSDNARILEQTGAFGDAGIGNIIRSVLGDAFSVKVEWNG